MSDAGQIVIRDGDTPNNIVLYDEASGYRPTVIAGQSWPNAEFTDLGSSPGISDDGQVIAFYGNLSQPDADTINRTNGDTVPVPVTPGPGIFASIAIDGTRYIIRIAGESHNGQIDPGERKRLDDGQDVGPDFNFDGNADWEIGQGGFSPNARVGVSAVQPFDDPGRGSYVDIVYLANDTVGTTGKAIYSSRLNLFKDSGENHPSRRRSPHRGCTRRRQPGRLRTYN